MHWASRKTISFNAPGFRGPFIPDAAGHNVDGVRTFDEVKSNSLTKIRATPQINRYLSRAEQEPNARFRLFKRPGAQLTEPLKRAIARLPNFKVYNFHGGNQFSDPATGRLLQGNPQTGKLDEPSPPSPPTPKPDFGDGCAGCGPIGAPLNEENSQREGGGREGGSRGFRVPFRVPFLPFE